MNAIVRASCAAALVLAATGAPAATVVITQWNFNAQAANDPNPTAPSTGTGTLSVIGALLASPPRASGSADGGSSDPAPSTPPDYGLSTTSYPAQGAGNKTSGIEVRVSTLGFQNIRISYDLRHSNTSSRYEQVQISTGGGVFTDFGAPFDGNAGSTWFNGRSADLSAMLAANDNASFAFRVVSAFAPGTNGYLASDPGSSYGSTGTWRFDMVTVSGTVIPLPAALPLLASGLLALGLLLRRRAA